MATASFKISDKEPVNIGMDDEDRTEVCQAISSCLANTQLLFQKTLFYHWNVTGPNFYSLHKLFEKQYNQLKNIGDSVAERIRALGHKVPGTNREFNELATIKEDENLPSSWQDMIKNLLQSHELSSEEARRVLEIAEDLEDDVTANAMVELMEFHEKSAWMLRSTLEDNQA